MKKLITSVLIAINCFGVEFVVDGKSTMSDEDYQQVIKEYVDRHYPEKVKEFKQPWKDPDTGLIWQKQIFIKEYNWQEAKNYCQNLSLAGYNDWRLPSIDELKSILTEEAYKNLRSYTGKTYIKQPLLNSMTMKYQWFWSSTNYKEDLSKAWVVGFGIGNDSWGYRTSIYYVRCVK